MAAIKKISRQKGFNLVELMVVVGIFAVVNLVIFAGYPAFNRRIAMKKTAAEIAMVARQAQSYSLANKRFDNANGSYFPNYGIHFEKNKDYFALFADANGNGVYGGSSGCTDAECAEFFQISTSNSVSDIFLCRDASNCNSYSKIEVVYPRGRTSALASASGDGTSCSSCSYAKIALRSLGDLVPPKYIYIWLNGQISIKDE